MAMPKAETSTMRTIPKVEARVMPERLVSIQMLTQQAHLITIRTQDHVLVLAEIAKPE